MSERLAIARLRVSGLNRRIESTGRHVEIQQRNGHVALDEYRGESCVRLITVGTASEIATYLDAMIVGVDLSRAS